MKKFKITNDGYQFTDGENSSNLEFLEGKLKFIQNSSNIALDIQQGKFQLLSETTEEIRNTILSQQSILIESEDVSDDSTNKSTININPTQITKESNSIVNNATNSIENNIYVDGEEVISNISTRTLLEGSQTQFETSHSYRSFNKKFEITLESDGLTITTEGVVKIEDDSLAEGLFKYEITNLHNILSAILGNNFNANKSFFKIKINGLELELDEFTSRINSEDSKYILVITLDFELEDGDIITVTT